jgi:hypothetical protein
LALDRRLLAREAFAMSDATLLIGADHQRRLDRSSYFEQRLFGYSPFGTLVTSICIFALFAGTFLLASALDGRHAFSFARAELIIADDARGALTISLLVAVSLGLQRYARLKDIRDYAKQYAQFRRSNNATQFGALAPDRGIIAATVFGVVFGTAAMFTFIPHPPIRSFSFAWFLLATIALSVLFARGVALTRAGNRATKRFIDSELDIDLLRVDQLTLIGRSAARTALIWFGVSAVLCLFFTSDGITVFTVALVLGSIGMGIAIFVATMSHVHRRIRDAKRAELERIRSQIEAIRHEVHASADAAQRLQGLIAYETRIAAAPEWPFDQPTAMRVGASALILTVPWFGQAVAGTLVERLGHLLH